MKLVSKLLLGIALAAVSLTIHAGHCDFQMYSDFLGRSLKACQTADSVEDCGIWPSTIQSDRVMAAAEGMGTDLIVLEDGDCEAERAVGRCILADSAITFYEGKQEHLETGCSSMLGTWQPAPIE